MKQLLLPFIVFFPILSALPLFALLRRRDALRARLIVALTAVTVPASAALLGNEDLTLTLSSLCFFGLRFRVTAFGAVMTLFACGLWLCTALTSLEYFAHHARCKARYDAFYLVTLGALCGVFLAADLQTVFVFFEIMSFTSYVWVVQNETEAAIRASNAYLAVAVFGGMSLLMGLFLLQCRFGTLEYAALRDAVSAMQGERTWLYAAGVCALLGFGAKAGMFPLHLWLPMAHPAAPAPASALLSGILTKSGVFGVLAVSVNLFYGDVTWGRLLLLLATVTMLLGAVLAVASHDIKRTLACSSMSQIGFILFGTAAQCLLGEHNAIAVWGTVLHMFNHSLIKLVLFTAAGVIYCGTHSLAYDDIRGFGRGKPCLMLPFLVGALAIGGVPLFSGYVSKTLIHESVVEYMALCGGSVRLYKVCELLFLFSGGLTVAYMAELFTVVFIDRPQREHHAEPMRLATRLVLWAGSGILLLFGFAPHRTMERAAAFVEGFLHGSSAHLHAIRYLSAENLKGAAISLAIGAAIYLLVLRRAGGKHFSALVSSFRTGLGDCLLCIAEAGLDALALPARVLYGIGDFIVRWSVLLGAPIARLLASTGDIVVALLMKLVFFRAPRVIIPRQYDFYEREHQRDLVARTFSLDLLITGVGAVAVLVYLLIKM